MLCRVGNLEIRRTQPADAGSYECVAQFADGTTLRAASRLQIIRELVFFDILTAKCD